MYYISNSRERTKCIPLQITTCPYSEHEISLKILLKYSTIVWRIWDMKNKVRILISEGKKKQRTLLVTCGTKTGWNEHKWVLLLILPVWLCPLAKVGASGTSAFPTYKYCKSLFSIWLSSQLYSAFQEVEGP